MPRAFNPPSGVIYSANNEIDRGSNGLITRDWTAAFARRACAISLAKAEGVDLDAMAALQNDRHSVAADTGAGRARRGDQGGARARTRGVRRSALLGQLAEVGSRRRLRVRWSRSTKRSKTRCGGARSSTRWTNRCSSKFYEWAGAEKPAGLYSIIDDRKSRWFDDITTVEKREIARRHFPAARFAMRTNRLQSRIRRRPRTRLGSRACRSRSVTRSAALVFRSAGSSAAARCPVEGDGTTVMRISWNRLTPFAAWEHPSWRQIFDVGQWDEARVILPAGQSGHPMSPFYFDQNETWRKGQYRTPAVHARRRAGLRPNIGCCSFPDG